MVEIKFRTPDLLATMHRIDPVIAKLKVGVDNIGVRSTADLPFSPIRSSVAAAHDAALQSHAGDRVRVPSLMLSLRGDMTVALLYMTLYEQHLQAEMPAGFEGAIKAREAELLPVYRQVHQHTGVDDTYLMSRALASTIIACHVSGGS